MTMKDLNGNFWKAVTAVIVPLLFGAWLYAFSIDNRKVDKREMDQLCQRFDRMEQKIDQLVTRWIK